MPDNTIVDGKKLSPSEFSQQIIDFYINIGVTALPSTVNLTRDPERKLQVFSIREAKLLLKNWTHPRLLATKIFLLGCQNLA